MGKRRVVVTGMGIVSPIGNSVDTFWENVKKQTVGIKKIDRFDVTDFKTKLAAQVDDFDPSQFMDAKAARRMELFSQYAVAATKQALDQSGMDLEKEDLNRFGVCVGSGIGSLQSMENAHTKLLEKEIQVLSRQLDMVKRQISITKNNEKRLWHCRVIVNKK